MNVNEYLEAPQHPIICRLADYWQRRRAGREFPGRQHIDPADFAYALGNLLLVDVDAGRFRYRLFGANVVERHGYDLTGRVLNDMPQTEYRDFVMAAYSRVVALRKPLFNAGSRTVADRLWLYQGALLPLARDGVTIDMLMVYVAFIEPAPDAARAEA